ncbi:MAG: MFS transporter, partial [Polyangiales bacterium]
MSTSKPPVTRRFAPASLLFGNFVVGTSVLAPTGMLAELSEGLQVTVREASLLVTFGAVVLCIGTPLVSWLTSQMDRRVLLVGSLGIVALAQIASAFAPSYGALLALRLLMLAAAAPFTPQAAGVVGLILPLERRASAIAYIFLGWSLAAAAGLPLMTAIASRFGWPYCFVLVAIIAAISCALLAWRL